MCKPLTAKHAMMIISILDQLRKVLPVCCNSNCTELLRQVGVSASDILHRPRGVSRGSQVWRSGELGVGHYCRGAGQQAQGQNLGEGWHHSEWETVESRQKASLHQVRAQLKPSLVLELYALVLYQDH